MILHIITMDVSQSQWVFVIYKLWIMNGINEVVIAVVIVKVVAGVGALVPV